MGVTRITAPWRRTRKRKRAGWKAALPAAHAVVVRRPQRKPRRPSAWKLVGLAGFAGVAATGVIVARNRRAHSDLEPDEVRERLRSRLAEVAAGSEPQPREPPA